MSLKDLIELCKTEYFSLLNFASLIRGDPNTLIISAMRYVNNTRIIANTPPPGRPDDIDSLANAYVSAKARAQSLRAELVTIASQDLPDAAAGDAAATAAEVADGFVRIFDSEVVGLQSAHSALRAYAANLRVTIAQHAVGANSIHSGRSVIKSLRPDVIDLLLPWERADEIARLIRELRRGIQLITEGVSQCRSAYAQSWSDGLALQRRLSDSKGYARLAGLTVPEGISAFDVITARTMGPGSNPDQSILSGSEWSNFDKRWKSLSASEREELLAALRDAKDVESRALIMSAFATGAPIPAVLVFASVVKTMTDKQRRELANLDLLGSTASAGGARFDQYNDKTCGSTSLLMLAAQSDPFLAYWLATGMTLDGHTPPYVAGLDLGQASGMSAEDRISFAEQAIQDRANNNPFPFGLDWPNFVGTAPAGAAREASRTETDYSLNWTSLLAIEGDAGAAITAVADAVNEGTPVPLLVGPAGGAFPQHYVLVVGYHDGMFEVYEPSSGKVHNVSEAIMLNGSDSAVGGFGNWQQLYAVIVPD